MKEMALAGAWKHKFDEKLAREDVRRLVPRPRSAPPTAVLRLPTSSAGTRMQQGWAAPAHGFDDDGRAQTNWPTPSNRELAWHVRRAMEQQPHMRRHHVRRAMEQVRAC